MMRRHSRKNNAVPKAPWRRWLLICAAALVLCSCRNLTVGRTPPVGPGTQGAGLRAPAGETAERTLANNGALAPPASDGVARVERAAASEYAGATDARLAQHHCPALPPAWGDVPPVCACLPTMTGGPPVPWAPPGIRRPWPHDEYLCDGGDEDSAVWIGKDRIVRGLNLEDAVVHYDTADGRVLVQPTNRVCIYAPRFAAVRKVSGTAQQEQHQRTARLELPIQSGRHEEWQAANTVLQPVQVERELGMKPANSFRTRAAGAELDNDRVLAAAQDRRDLYEEVNVARRSTLENAEKPRLAETLESALVRTLGQDVQVVIDGHSAMAAVSDRSVETVFVCELPPGKPRLQVIKTSSRREAKPGDVVDFAIRFVNVGDQLIRHVTVVDNLAPRLEYIVGTAQCTLKAEFSAQENERESLVLRWEIAAPLKVGQGGEIRFRCRVL